MSVVVPVYDSESILDGLVTRVIGVVEPIAREWEIVLVNDGSTDGSWGRILGLTAQQTRVRGIDLMRNAGQHNALLAGIREARFDLVVTLDDDLQNPPEEIPRLIAKLDEGYDVVYGTPATPDRGLWRRLATRFTKWALQSVMGPIAKQISPYRAFRRDLRDAFAHYQAPYVSIDALLTWGTSRFAAIPVGHEARAAGKSHYTFRKLARYALDMTTGFTTRPLQLASLVGFFFALFGVGILIWVIARRIVSGNPVPGFPFLASIVAIFSGAQLFALGIIGEYLARMHFRTMEKPAYAVRSRAVGGSEQRP